MLRRRFLDDYLSSHPDRKLEQELLQTAAKDGKISAFVHRGFWQCMDTAWEYRLLNEL